MAEPVPGPTIEMLAACAGGTELAAGGPYVVVGLLERTADPAIVYNSAALIGPDGLVGIYRKAHLPLLGVDRFTTPGDTGFLVWDTEIGRVGIIICYDLRFPEAMRTLALSGADIIALPTTGPTGRKRAPVVHAHASAGEPCLRPGVQSLWRGEWLLVLRHSQITDPRGDVLVEAVDGEELRYAEIAPLQARQKRIVLRPGEFELDTLGDRRPALYGQIMEAL